MALVSRVYLLLEAMVRWICNILILVLLGVLISAVVVRYFSLFEGSLAWSEEFGRFSMVWITMLGSVIAFDRGQHLAIGMVPAHAPRWLKRVIDALTYLLCAVFLGVLAWQSVAIAGKTMRQISPALGLPFGYVYLAMAVGAGLILAQLVVFLVVPRLRAERIARHASDSDF